MRIQQYTRSVHAYKQQGRTHTGFASVAVVPRRALAKIRPRAVAERAAVGHVTRGVRVAPRCSFITAVKQTGEHRASGKQKTLVHARRREGTERTCVAVVAGPKTRTAAEVGSGAAAFV
jgi:hypothetical protein